MSGAARPELESSRKSRLDSKKLTSKTPVLRSLGRWAQQMCGAGGHPEDLVNEVKEERNLVAAYENGAPLICRSA